MKISVLLAFCVTMITNQVYAQKGLRLGVGTNVLSGNTDKFQIFDLYPEDVTLKTPVGMSLIAEYGISERLMIRSGMEYKFQNIKIAEFGYFRAEFISIPILVDYQLFHNEEKKYSFGITGGLSLDKIGNNSAFYRRHTLINGDSEIHVSTFYTVPIRVLEFTDISGRFGLNFKKELSNKHQVNLYVMYYTPLSDFQFYVNVHLKRTVFSPPTVFVLSESDDRFKLLNQGLMIGVNYTFGPLK